MKKFSMFIVLLIIILCFTSCGSSKVTENSSNDPLAAKHEELLHYGDEETPYSELFNTYKEVLKHQAEHNCDFDKSYLFKMMLLGEWKDNKGNYINHKLVYKDYENKSGSYYFGTNLPTSKISGNDYYYYTEVGGESLKIGYKDTITEEGKDNFIVSFNESSITVESKIENKTYTLLPNKNFKKTQKGNAKLAYICIAKKIFSFKDPASVVVTECYVDYEEQIVYATIQAKNSYGAAVSEDYKLCEIGGVYYMIEYPANFSTNIDLEELNKKLQDYVASGK